MLLSERGRAEREEGGEKETIYQVYEGHGISTISHVKSNAGYRTKIPDTRNN
jgi:hypothetical protein